MIADEPPTPASKSSAPIHCRAIHQTHAKSTNAKHRDQLATSSKGTHHAHHTGTTLRNTASRGTARNRATQHFPRTATAAASAAKGRASAALPQFHPLVAGQGISLFGNMMLRFAMSMWVLDETGSATAFASILAISFVPMILGAPFGGVLADRMNRRTLMVILDAASAVTVALALRLVLRRRIQHHRRGRNAGGAIAARYLRDADRRIRAAADAAPIRGCDAEHQRRDSQSGAAGQRTDTQLPRSAVYSFFGIRPMMASPWRHSPARRPSNASSGLVCPNATRRCRRHSTTSRPLCGS